MNKEQEQYPQKYNLYRGDLCLTLEVMPGTTGYSYHFHLNDNDPGYVVDKVLPQTEGAHLLVGMLKDGWQMHDVPEFVINALIQPTERNKSNRTEYTGTCPKCKSDNIERDFCDISESGTCHLPCTCNNCFTQWNEMFAFTKIELTYEIPHFDRLMPGDVVVFEGSNYPIKEIISQANYREFDPVTRKYGPECWYLEFRDKWDDLHYWKQDSDGGYVYRPVK